jgi:hypothetical protein
LERQYKIFIAVVGAAFAALIVLAFYNPLQQLGADSGNGPDVIKAKKGQQVYVRYSSSVVSMIQKLPDNNSVELEVSSELQVTNFAGLNGEIRYPIMEITYVQNGKEETVSEKDFKTIAYRFFPDVGNKTKYAYEDVDYIAKADNSQVVVTVKSLSTAKVGAHYTVKMVLNTGSMVSYAIGEKTIEIVG